MKKKLPLQVDLKTRDSTLVKDSITVNGYVEQSPSKKVYTVKRPGIIAEVSGLGAAQGMFYYGGNLYSWPGPQITSVSNMKKRYVVSDTQYSSDDTYRYVKVSPDLNNVYTNGDYFSNSGIPLASGSYIDSGSAVDSPQMTNVGKNTYTYKYIQPVASVFSGTSTLTGTVSVTPGGSFTIVGWNSSGIAAWWDTSLNEHDLTAGYAYGLDANIIVGRTSATPCYWEYNGTKHNLPTLSLSSVSTAYGIHNSIIVGESFNTMGYKRAVFWDSSHNIHDLGLLPGAPASGQSGALGVYNGIIVGSSTASDTNITACYWDSMYTIYSLPHLSSVYKNSIAYGIYNNIVVGISKTDSGNYHACYWDLNTSSIHDLGTLGGSTSFAYGVSGNVVVGYAWSLSDILACYWTLNDLNIHQLSSSKVARATNGYIIVGDGGYWELNGTYHAIAGSPNLFGVI